MKKIVLTFMAVCTLMPMMAQQTTETDSMQQFLREATRQQYSGNLSLSLEEATRYAIQQNRSLQNASLEVKKAHAQRWQTIASMLPQVDATGSYTNMCGYKIDFGGMSRGMVPYLNLGVTASVGINGQAVVGVLLNNLAIEMQDISREKSENDLRASVVKSYAAVLVLEDVVQLLDSSLQNVKKLAQQTATMASVGAVEQTQADQIQVRVNQLTNNVVANERNLALAYNALRVLLDVDANTELKLTTHSNELLDKDKTLGMLLQGFTLQDNYDYQLLQKNVELAKKNVDMAGWAYGPTVSAYYQYSYRKDMEEGGFSMAPPHTVGVSVALPIWSSGKRASAVTEKKIALQEAENTLNETSDNLGIQYQQLRYNLANAYATYLTEKKNLDVTQRVMQNVTNKYNWGVSSSLELTNASNDLITAQSTYVNSVLTLVDASVELEKFLNNK